MTDNVVRLERVQVFDTDKDGQPISRIEMQSVDELREALCDAHGQEADRIAAEFYNFGWASSDREITSKTTLGYLWSKIDPETGKVTHELLPY